MYKKNPSIGHKIFISCKTLSSNMIQKRLKCHGNALKQICQHFFGILTNFHPAHNRHY